MSDRLGAADPRLADPDWMRRAYAQHGDMWISLETGAARGTVRKRREDLGIQSAPPGRRRGVTLLPSVRQRSHLHPVIERILARARAATDPPAGSHALEIFAAADRARRRHNRPQERFAWEQLAAHAIRMAQHLDQIDQAR